MAVHLNVLSGSPEVTEGTVVRVGAAIWSLEIAECDILWCVSKTHDLSVETDLDVHVMVSRLEHDSISAITPLAMVAIAALLMIDVIDNLLSSAVVWLDDLNSAAVPIGWIWFCTNSNNRRAE